MFKFKTYFLSLLILLMTGCATTPYHYTQSINFPNEPTPLRTGEAQIERGAPHKVLDTAGSIIGIPTKIILWNRKMVNHHVSPETEQAAAIYLQKNNLTAVKVRINEYAPGDEWYRLTHNQTVGVGYRYTLGVIDWLFYTILPGRLFASSDYYNAMTNTLNIYSDSIPVIIHEAGHAKDFAQRKNPGTYSLLYSVPFVNLYHEARASNDAMSYFAEEKDNAHLKEGYQTLYPAYSTYIGADIVNAGAQPLFYWGSVIVGHVVGRVKAEKIENAEK